MSCIRLGSSEYSAPLAPFSTFDLLEPLNFRMQVDPNGERTIGVLTKPDLIGEGNEEEVMAVLHNTRKPLRLGYVMVKVS